MSRKYIVGSDRYQYKLTGGFLLTASLLAALVFASDIRGEYAFAKEGVKSKAMVTGGSYMTNRMGLSQGHSPYQVAFDYAYSVEGKSYENHVPNNYISHSKGDVIEIEYLGNNPGVSRFIGDAKGVSDIKTLLVVCGIGGVIGLLMLLIPIKPLPNNEEQMDWDEYERTH